MDYYWVETTVADCAFDALQEAEGAVVCDIFSFFFEDENFYEDGIGQVAVVYEIEDGVVVADSNETRSQGYFSSPTFT